MFFGRKKTAKPIDFTLLESLPAQTNTPGFDTLGSFGASIPLEDVPEANAAYRSPFDDWRRLGERAWRVLDERRMRDIFPGCDDFEGCSEFLLYWELIRRSSLRYRNEVFVGLRPPPGKPAPIFVPRSTFDGHGYILGKTARGKTSQALATVLLQLAMPAAHSGEDPNVDSSPPAIIIFDPKPQGDRFLRSLAELIARQREQELQFFSNAKRYASLLFDPWSVIASMDDVQAQAEFILKGLSLIHPESQESIFFMGEQRYELEQSFLRKPRSLRQLITWVEERTRGRGGNPEGRGAHAALQIFENATNIIVDEPPANRANVIDLRRLLDNREVLYVHLETDEKKLSSQAVAKFLISCLLTVAKQRREDDRLEPTRAYVFFDEFQEVAAENIVSYLTRSRDLGVSFILSHQSPKSLRSKHDDLFRLLFDITSFQQYLSLTNAEAIELLRLVSRRQSELLHNSSRGTTQSNSESTGWNQQQTYGTSGGYSYGLWGKDERWSDGWHESQGYGISGGAQRGRAEHEGSGESEAKIPSPTDEMIRQVNAPNERVSLVVSWGETDSSISPIHGDTTLVHRIFPFSKSLADSFRREPWPLREKPPGAPSEYRGPLLLASPKGTKSKGRSKRDDFNQIGEAVFKASKSPPVGGRRSRASRGKKKS